MRRIAFSILFALVAAGCGKDLPVSPRLTVERITPPFGRDYTGLRDPARLVIRDAQTFESVWGAAYANRQPAPPVPAVDFTKDMVIVVAMGEQNSGGHAIEVSGVRLVSGQPVVDVKSTLPGYGCAVSLALTQPIDIVKVAAVRGLIQFEDRSERVRCP